MQYKTALAIVFFILSLCQRGSALAVRFHPADGLYLHEANPGYGTYDVVVHLVLIQNDSTETVTLEKVDLRFYSGERIVQEVHPDPAQVAASTAELLEMGKQGMQFMSDIIVPPQALGKGGKLAGSLELKGGDTLTARNLYTTLKETPDRLEARAVARNAAGKEVEASGEIKIVRYKSPNTYLFPLEGVWYMQAIPNVTSHHRWMSQTEFGIDFLKLDENGSMYKTDGKSAADYYGFGKLVVSAADGIVVKAINDATQDWDQWIRREGETHEAFENRSSQAQMAAMKKDLYRAVTGNLVVIEHPGSEYSAYAHLRQGSVRVKTGDRVKQGQVIAEVGDTGDYYMAHLHFQISNQPDVLYGRSLPFEFANVRKWSELGYFAKPRK